jgi:DNA-binding transcriptional MerR regulator
VISMKAYKGIEITRPFHLSPDLLRKYETWKLIPRADRGDNNYRLYNETHKVFFQASRRMLIGYSWTEVAKMMKLLVEKDAEAATVLAIEFQAKLVGNYKEGKHVISQLKKTISKHGVNEDSLAKRIDRLITISEISDIINRPVSTLRVWEQHQLFEPIRGDNNYRYFNQKLLNRLFTIKLLRLSGLGFKQCQHILKELDQKNFNEIIIILEKRLKDMKKDINNGLKALGHLNDLIIHLEGDDYFE